MEGPSPGSSPPPTRLRARLLLFHQGFPLAAQPTHPSISEIFLTWSFFSIRYHEMSQPKDGKSSAEVRIYNDHVTKTFVKEKEYRNEKEALLSLQGLPHFPRLLGVDDDRMQVRMALCRGSRLDKVPCPRTWREQARDILSTFASRGIWHDDLNAGNVLVGSDGNICVIDFARSHIVDRSDPIWEEAMSAVNSAESCTSIHLNQQEREKLKARLKERKK